MTDITWTTEQRRLGDLIPRDRNPAKISEHDAAHLETSVDKFNLALPLIIQPDDKLIDGHQRQKVLLLSESFGEDTIVDVRVPSRPLTDEEVDELAIRLRRNAGEWDWEILEADFDREDLVNWGFHEEELGEWKSRTPTPTKEKPELEISPELLERHDYVVFYFDNELDWQVAQDLLGVEKVKGGPVGNKTIVQTGLGRVIPGSLLLEKLA
jgi:hypothetical protein